MTVIEIHSTARLMGGVLACLAFAVPAQAQMGQSNPGTGEVPRNLPGAGIRLERAAPIAPPSIEPKGSEAQRAAPLGEADAADSFGIVTRSSDGTETRTAPDEKFRAIIRESAQPPAGGRLDVKPPDAQDPAFNLNETSRQVFGEDDRVPISTTTTFPFSTFGFIQGRTPKGNWGSCSGTLIGPRTVLTAAHCIYSHEEGGWLDDVVFAPGLSGYENAPYGAFSAASTAVLQGYLDKFKGYYGSVFSWDLGVITLRESVGDYTGYLGYAHYDGLGGFSANIVGYPGDKEPGTMWRASCQVATKDIASNYMDYKCDTYRGSSGSSVYAYDRDQRQRIVLGVNVAESPQANTAVRLAAPYVEWVNRLWK